MPASHRCHRQMSPTRRLLHRISSPHNLISMMYYVSPCSAVCLFIPWLFWEKPKMDACVSWNFLPVTLFLNCLCTFILNPSVFLVISRTSALTARVTGVVRDWSVVLLSAAIFADTKLTFINIIRYAIAIVGVVAYNNHKLRLKPQANQQQGADSDSKVNPGRPQDVELSFGVMRPQKKPRDTKSNGVLLNIFLVQKKGNDIGNIKLLGTWRSPFALRARLALNFMGLSYEYFEEDLANKSDLLLSSNPVNMEVPVLIHNGVPICESLAILEYIEEVFGTVTGLSLLPSDPYERAVARFWAAYIDNKLVAPWWKMFKGKTDEEKAQGTKQTLAAVETLEGALKECSKGKPFFGGDDVGYVDVVLGGMVAWMQGTEALCGVELFDAAKTPLLMAWMERFGGLDAAKVILPDVGRLVEYATTKRALKAPI